MRIEITGFVSEQSGSVASANAVLLSRLLARRIRVDFFCKPSFVDPRKYLGPDVLNESFQLVDCTNNRSDRLRRRMSPSGKGVWGHLWGQMDAFYYNRGLVRSMSSNLEGDCQLWLGDWARGQSTRPVVTFAQGPPGTDADSVIERRSLIIRLAGQATWVKLAAVAAWRTRIGKPPIRFSDHVIVGSQWSRERMHERCDISSESVHAVPYPIDLNQFRRCERARETTGPLKLIWLGRFVPRKRLDLFLDGMALAIRSGCDVEGLVIGSSGFVPNYERLIQEFPFPDRIVHRASVPRKDVPEILASVDVMAQPSDDENFGSSVAEALACGIPAIVGATNGTGDYVCERSIRLADDKPETMAAAIVAMADAKKRGELRDREPSRSAAERHFDPERVTDQLEDILKLAVRNHQ